jgi:hypothetical protein
MYLFKSNKKIGVVKATPLSYQASPLEGEDERETIHSHTTEKRDIYRRVWFV